MSVHQLTSAYVKAVNPAQLEQWVQNGVVIKQGNDYYVSSDAGMKFPDSFFVSANDGSAKTFQLDGKGTIVEKRNNASDPSRGRVVGEPVVTSTASFQNILEIMGIQDKPELKSKLVEFLKTKTDIVTLNMENDEVASVSFKGCTEAQLYKVLNEFIDANKAEFVAAGAKVVEFDDGSSQKLIADLGKGDNPAIADKPTEDGGRTYVVKDEGVLLETLKPQGDPTIEAGEARSVGLNITTTTTTTREENLVDVPDNLRGSKGARKKLEADAREAYANLVANADTATRDAIDLYIANGRYDGKINKRMGELLQYETTVGGKKKKFTRDSADIVQLYINQYANDADRAKLNETVTAVQNSKEQSDKDAIVKALKDANIIGADLSYDNLSDDLKRKGALICVAKACGYDSDTLLRLMATHDVMAGRDSAQIAKDDKWFIDQQAKDYVRNQQTSQDIPNTDVYFSKKGRKQAPENGKIHTDIGDKGRQLVKTCPDLLCDKVGNDVPLSEDNGVFEVNGKRYKFSPDKWKAFMGICCDPSNQHDEELNILFGSDTERRQSFERDLNLTLQEGRSVLEMKLPSPYGETGTLQFANIIGNNNSKIDNKELNALRNMVKSAGYSVDGNSTYAKRLLHVLGQTAIGTGIGIATAGFGSLLSGAVSFGAETLTNIVTVTGNGNMTGNATLTGSATLEYHDNVTTTDTFTDQYGTTTSTHQTPVNGQVTGDVTLTGNTTINGQGTVTGEVNTEVPGRSGNNHGSTAINGGILGAIGGGVHGLATMNGVHERGRNMDDVFSLRRTVTDTSEPEASTANGSLNQYTSRQRVEGSKEVGVDIPKKPVRPYQGPAAYAVLYQYEDDTSVSGKDFAKVYQAQVGGIMTNKFFFAYPEYKINGKKVVLKTNWKDLYNGIPEGTPGGKAGVEHTPAGKETCTAKGVLYS